MPASAFSSQAALLIDWENLKSSLNDQLHALPDVVTLKKAVRGLGATLRLARAYADWSDPWHAGDSHRLSQQGVDPIHIEGRHAGSNAPVKNSADIRLACDGVELLSSHPSLETFVIVSGDGGLVHLAEKLKGHGRRVVAIAVKGSLSSLLRVACDQTIHYDDLIAGLRPSGESEGAREAIEAFGSVVAALHAAGRDTSLPAVKAEMVQRQEGFNEEALGIPTFRHLAFLAESRGFAAIDARTEPYTAYPDCSGKSGLFNVDAWRFLVASMEPDRDYPPSELAGALKSDGVGAENVKALVQVAKASGVLWFRQQKIRLSGADRFTGQYRLNVHHPRVQVLRMA
jgi:hypothetical protein